MSKKGAHLPRGKHAPPSGQARFHRERFATEYLVDMNGAAAARRAGYSPRTAKAKACTLLHDPEMRQRIDDLIAERAARAQVKADDVIAELHAVAFRPVVDAHKVRALELLGKHLNILRDTVNVTAAVHMTLSPAERKKRIDAMMGAAIARRAAVSTNGNGNGNHP